MTPAAAVQAKATSNQLNPAGPPCTRVNTANASSAGNSMIAAGR